LAKYVKLALVPAALVLALATAGLVGASVRHTTASDTLVFGAAADPVTLDPALASDGESFRPARQIFEGLTSLKPGTTQIEPALATSWKSSKDGKTWTFQLRTGVKFTDGTPFNAAAVCFNFNRWYNFRGALQNPSASYYYNTVFAGFAHPDAKGVGGPAQALYKGCTTQGDSQATITLRRPNGAFLGATSLVSFAMQSPSALKQYDADKGTVDSNGVFHPGGTYGTAHPTGTGPFMFQSWDRGNKLVLVRNPDYWGKKPALSTLIFRPIPDNAARLQALQTGEIQGYDLVEPQDIATIQGNSNLKILSRPAFNVAYVGFNMNSKPMDNLLVRQAVAYGLDRSTVVKSFYAGRGVVANEFMPPLVQGYAKDVVKYPYNPAKAKALLKKAGLKMPVKLDFWYPTDVSRPYMPDPQRNFQAFAASLAKSGFKIVPHSAPWNPDFLGRANSGTAGNLYLLGWTGDYGDADNFIGTFFRTPQPQFGTNGGYGETTMKPVMNLLNAALAEPDQDKRTALYQQANRLIMKLLPGVPYAHTSPALAFQKNVNGYVPSPTTDESFASVTIS
jgi:peptide/nickel transport system substrate-binding protein